LGLHQNLGLGSTARHYLNFKNSGMNRELITTNVFPYLKKKHDQPKVHNCYNGLPLSKATLPLNGCFLSSQLGNFKTIPPLRLKKKFTKHQNFGIKLHTIKTGSFKLHGIRPLFCRCANNVVCKSKMTNFG